MKSLCYIALLSVLSASLTADEIKAFSGHWDFEHITSGEANGLTEEENRDSGEPVVIQLEFIDKTTLKLDSGSFLEGLTPTKTSVNKIEWMSPTSFFLPLDGSNNPELTLRFILKEKGLLRVEAPWFEKGRPLVLVFRKKEDIQAE